MPLVGGWTTAPGTASQVSAALSGVPGCSLWYVSMSSGSSCLRTHSLTLHEPGIGGWREVTARDTRVNAWHASAGTSPHFPLACMDTLRADAGDGSCRTVTAMPEPEPGMRDALRDAHVPEPNTPSSPFSHHPSLHLPFSNPLIQSTTASARPRLQATARAAITATSSRARQELRTILTLHERSSRLVVVVVVVGRQSPRAVPRRPAAAGRKVWRRA